MRPTVAKLLSLLLPLLILLLLLLAGDGTFARAPRSELFGRGVQAGLLPTRSQHLASLFAIAALVVVAREGGRLRRS